MTVSRLAALSLEYAKGLYTILSGYSSFQEGFTFYLAVFPGINPLRSFKVFLFPPSPPFIAPPPKKKPLIAKKTKTKKRTESPFKTQKTLFRGKKIVYIERHFFLV